MPLRKLMRGPEGGGWFPAGLHVDDRPALALGGVETFAELAAVGFAIV
jgi:hypothetical protein